MLCFLLTRTPTVAGPVHPLTGSVSITIAALSSPAAPDAARLASTRPPPHGTPCISSFKFGAGACPIPRTPCTFSFGAVAGRHLAASSPRTWLIYRRLRGAVATTQVHHFSQRPAAGRNGWTSIMCTAYKLLGASSTYPCCSVEGGGRGQRDYLSLECRACTPAAGSRECVWPRTCGRHSGEETVLLEVV